jgi:hypothetical protein
VAAGEHTEAPWRAHGRTPGKATSAAGVEGGTRGEREGESRTAARQDSAQGRWPALATEGVQRKKKGKRDQGLICKTLKAQGSNCKLKILTDLRIK